MSICVVQTSFVDILSKMASRWQKRQLWVIEKGFFYLPNFPLIVNRNNETIEKSPTKRKRANNSFVVMTGISVVTAILILILGTSKMSKLTSIKDIDVLYLILMNFALFILGITVLACIFYKERQTTIFGLNKLNSINKKMQAGKQI